MARSQEHLRGLCATHPDELGLYHGTGDDCVPACGRCAGHGTIQGIRFNMNDSPVESYREPCPQCMGSGESGFVHCFYGCGFVVRDISPFEAHRRMEGHFEVAHREELEKLQYEKVVIYRGVVMESPFYMEIDWYLGEASLETDETDGTYRLVPVGGEN